MTRCVSCDRRFTDDDLTDSGCIPPHTRRIRQGRLALCDGAGRKVGPARRLPDPPFEELFPEEPVSVVAVPSAFESNRRKY